MVSIEWQTSARTVICSSRCVVVSTSGPVFILGPDLTVAIFSGGGGTFGVVLEATILASPRITVQTVIIKFNPNKDLTRELWKILTDNGLQMAEDGWGGFSNAGTLVLVNPRLNANEAAKSVAPLIAFGNRIKEDMTGSTLLVAELSSWGAFFKLFTRDNVAVILPAFSPTDRSVVDGHFPVGCWKESGDSFEARQ